MMDRFNGAATKYLANYMYWFKWLEIFSIDKDTIKSKNLLVQSHISHTDTKLKDFIVRETIYENSFYLPDKWSPHCTIASRLDEDKMVQAFRYCKNNIDKIYSKLSEIALIELKLNNDGVAIEDTIVFSKELK